MIDPIARATIRPSLSVTGITGGYQGASPKSVIPARANEKFYLPNFFKGIATSIAFLAEIGARLGSGTTERRPGTRKAAGVRMVA